MTFDVGLWRAQRHAKLSAVGFARVRAQARAGRLRIAWMSEEEKAAYRLREVPDTPADAKAGRPR